MTLIKIAIEFKDCRACRLLDKSLENAYINVNDCTQAQCVLLEVKCFLESYSLKYAWRSCVQFFNEHQMYGSLHETCFAHPMLDTFWQQGYQLQDKADWWLLITMWWRSCYDPDGNWWRSCDDLCENIFIAGDYFVKICLVTWWWPWNIYDNISWHLMTSNIDCYCWSQTLPVLNR